MLKRKQTRWYPLDNAAKIYPPTASADRAHVFAFSALLTEQVNSFLLQQAVTKALEQFPTFKTKLMKGNFWYYLEENKLPVKVFKEDAYYLKPIDYKLNNGYLFEVLYIRNKITIKFFHALTDGTGGLEFFKTVLVEYFSFLGEKADSEGVVKPIDAPANALNEEDSFLKYQNSSKEKKKTIPKPYHIEGTPFDYDGCGMITLKTDVSKIKEVAKHFGVTVTAYLAGLYSYAIYKAYLNKRPVKNKKVTVLIPCNLRKKYGGETMRNFTMFARFIYDFSNSEPITLQNLCTLCAEQMNEDLRIDNLDKMIDDNVKSEKNFLVKITPLSVKNLLLRAIYSKVGEVLQTVNLSNLGVIKLPNGVSKMVKDITFAITPTFSCNHQTGVISFNDKLYLTFSRGFVETEVEKQFIEVLTESGVSVTVSSNYWESKI